MTRCRAIVTRERTMDDLTIEVEAQDEIAACTLEAIAAKLRQVLKLGADVTQVASGAIPEDAPVIEDRRRWS